MATRHAKRKGPVDGRGGFPLIIKRSLLIIRRSPNYCRPSRRRKRTLAFLKPVRVH